LTATDMMSFRFPYSSSVRALLLAALLVLGGCDVFDVKNPGVVQESDVTSPEGIEPLVVGMSADLSIALDELAIVGAQLSDEMEASGTFEPSRNARAGIIEPDQVDTEWERIQQARFLAEDGLDRLRTVLGDDFGNRKELGARALFFAGISNRILGENFNRVVFDGGAPMSRDSAFTRAIPFFQEAIQVAGDIGNQRLQRAARGGLAQVHMNLGNWSRAVQLADMVPTDFVFSAVYSRNTAREENEVWDETHDLNEISAFGALALEAKNDDILQPPFEQDPRAPFTFCFFAEGGVEGNCPDNGADGATPHVRQEKYPSGDSDIPLVKGTEMRLIEAEAILQQSNPDLSQFAAEINEVRAQYSALDPTNPPSEVGSLDYPARPGDPRDDDAWSILDRERHLTLWLEARRLNDLARWDHPFLNGNGVVYGRFAELEEIFDVQIVSRRASLLPVAESECDNNPRVDCQQVYQR
jgi:hypothetical protein